MFWEQVHESDVKMFVIGSENKIFNIKLFVKLII